MSVCHAGPVWVIALKCLVKGNDDSEKVLTNWMRLKVESHEMCEDWEAYWWLTNSRTPPPIPPAWHHHLPHQDNRWSFGTENILHKNNLIATKWGQYFWQTTIYQRLGQGDMTDVCQEKSKSRRLKLTAGAGAGAGGAGGWDQIGDKDGHCGWTNLFLKLISPQLCLHVKPVEMLHTTNSFAAAIFKSSTYKWIWQKDCKNREPR